MTTLQEQLDTPLAELEGYDLSTRAIATLEKAGYLYVRDLENVTRRQFREIPRFGRGKVEQLTKALRAFLAGDPPKRKEFLS